MATAQSGGRWYIGATLSLAALLFTAGMATAVFPPLYQQPPAPPAAPAAQVATVTTSPPVVIQGDPVVVVTPVVANPEPVSLVSGLIGLMLAGGYAWRKRRMERLQRLC